MFKFTVLGTAVSLILLLLTIGCSGNKETGEQEHAAEAGDVAAVPQTYNEAVAKCEALSREIDALIESGDLGQVHPKAQEIQSLARKLPKLAKGSVPLDALKDININSKQLAGLFDSIDAAGDSGDKEETVRVHEEMKKHILYFKDS